MGWFDNVRPGKAKAPFLKSFGVAGSGVVRCTGARLEKGQKPQTAAKTFLIVDGENVSHPACPAGTAIAVLIVDLTDETYSGSDIGGFLEPAVGDPSPACAARMFGEQTQAIKGVLVGVTTAPQVYGQRSPKAGQTFMATSYYRATEAETAAPAAVTPAAPAASPPAPAPAAPAPAPAAKPFPPAPWAEYAPGWYHDGAGNAKSEAELRAL